jgi:uncharacterized protein with LGFP repeats
MRSGSPVAADFGRPLPRMERVASGPGALAAKPGAGPVAYRSRPITAAHPFDLVGLAGEMRPVEYRSRAEGERWSGWVETSNGDPVYTGTARQVQLRARGWRPAGRLHFVNVSGTMDAGGSLLDRARGAIHGAFVSLAGLVDPVAQADPPRPGIVSREEWGANDDPGGCHPSAGPIYGTVRAAVVHHTVSTNTYTEAQAPGIVLGICRFHKHANGWNDIGYNALVDRFGNVYEGRAGGLSRAVVGAHAQGFNSQTTGVASIGDQSAVPISKDAMKGFAHFLAWKLFLHGVTHAKGHVDLVSAGGSFSRFPAGTLVRSGRISGHGHFDYTECPGGALLLQMDALRERVQRRIENHP